MLNKVRNFRNLTDDDCIKFWNSVKKNAQNIIENNFKEKSDEKNLLPVEPFPIQFVNFTPEEIVKYCEKMIRKINPSFSDTVPENQYSLL